MSGPAILIQINARRFEQRPVPTDGGATRPGASRDERAKAFTSVMHHFTARFASTVT
jgi:hypothetical protein